MAGPSISATVRRLGERPSGARPARRRDLIGPGAGGVDNDRGGELARAGGGGPETRLAPQARDAGVGSEPAAAAAQAGDVALVQGGDVDIHRAGFVESGDAGLRPQHRHARADLVAGEPGERAGLRRLGRERIQPRPLGLAGDEERAARAKQRRLAKALRRRGQEGPARAAQRPDDGVAVGLGEQRRRAAGGVEARLRLLLQHDHAVLACQLVRRRRAGHPGADHKDVGELRQTVSLASGRPAACAPRRTPPRTSWASAGRCSC